jgi:DNA modification methylase
MRRSKMAQRMTDGANVTRVNKWKLEVVQVPIGKLKAWNLNPRDNDKAAVKLAELLKEHGIINPLIATPDGTVRAGHTRMKAAVLAGFKEVPVIYIPFESERKAVEFALADNKSSEWAKWDVEKLQSIFAETLKVDVHVGSSLQEAALGTGFKASEIEGISAIADFSRADMVPQMPAAAVSRRGEVYKLGRHRLMCGDSSSVSDVDRLMAGAKIHLVNTDPPYNVKIEPRSNNAIAAGLSSFAGFGNNEHAPGAGKGLTHHQSFDVHRGATHAHGTTKKMRAKDRPLENDSVSDDAFEKMLQAWFGNIARVLLPGRCFYIWGGYANCGNYPPVLKVCELYFSQTIIWDKMWPVLTRKDFMSAHEWAFYGWKEGAGHRWFGPNNATDLWKIKTIDELPTDVWHIKKYNQTVTVHLTEKPVELATRAMQYSSQAGENVLDLFGGSGSTLIGAEQMNRNAYLMELDPAYTDVIRQRWSDFVYGKGCKWQSLTPSVK